jgi:hypothetical protein
MRTLSRVVGALVAALVFFSPGARAAARATSDLVPPLKRQTSVDTAERLSRRPPPTPLPADMPSPFNPVDFDKPDPTEVPAPVGPRPSTPVAGGAATAAQPIPPATDRQTLETLASQITPSGMITRGATPRLIFANRQFEVGTRFTASYNGQDYELELVAIDRTTFTLRYRGEDVTRPIKPVR